ncbi:MAG: exonuclease SbcCD subunit D C-terminal domain-containing protein [Mycobacteriales bacterium]|nr:exonuclease SbcCD subunit D C-terminal domain-containing protein [Mycobacteriales bacterium]
MRLLHTSDWHLGRSLHQHDLSAAQAGFVDHLVEVVRAERVDAVLLAGDVHDRALPPVEAMQLFDEALRRLRDAGAAVVAISGNHDAPARLGDKSGLLDPRISIRTDPRRVGEPVVLSDAHGDVAVYGVPYLEPAAVRDLLPGDRDVAGHTGVLTRAMDAVHADRAARGGRSVVLAHAWVTGGEASDSERDITVGGVANVPGSLFDGVDYTALGHLHRPQQLGDGLRYSGSPLPYSFSEAGHRKSSWLVELGATGLVSVEAVPVPVHRELVAVRGRLDDLLTSAEHTAVEACFVAVTLTDPVRPLDAMAALRRRFPHCLTLDFAPDGAAEGDGATYAERTRGRTDLQVAQAFVEHVRGELQDEETALMREALESARRDADLSLALA